MKSWTELGKYMLFKIKNYQLFHEIFDSTKAKNWIIKKVIALFDLMF